MTLSSEEITSLITNPDIAAERANLIYVSEAHFNIYRKKVRNTFEYFKNGKKVKQPKILERIEKLVIPPGWKEVRICDLEKGHIQVIGLDDRKRKQYLYHSSWTQIRNQTKFYKMIAFGKVLPRIRKQVDKDLDLPKMPQRKVLALIIRLMEETHIRIGNHCYAKQNKSYGLSTLRSRHVEVSKGKMKFHFFGKKGKEHSISVRNRKLIRLVNKCEEIPGWELFKYYDENGNKKTVDSGMVNEYIQDISGELYSAKDFRTWGATKIFFENLRDLGYTENEKENKKNIINALDATADALGNTRSVCRNSYVHPQVVHLYENGGIVPYFEKVARKRTVKPYVSQTEEVLMDLLKTFEIEVGRKEDVN